MSLKQVEWVPIMSFIDSTTAGADAALTNITLSWTGNAWVTNPDNYDAWIPVYAVLGVVAKDFKDPTGSHYKIGATDMGGKRYQISASMETEADNVALINGNYISRGIYSVATNAFDIDSVDTLNNTMTLESAWANFFKKGDFIRTVIAGDLAEITNVDRNGITITIADVTAFADTETIGLVNAESTGLVGESGDLTTAVTHKGVALPY